MGGVREGRRETGRMARVEREMKSNKEVTLREVERGKQNDRKE